MLVSRRNPQVQKSTVNKLSAWLDNIVNEGWQSIEQVLSPRLIPSFRSDIKRVKDLGLELSGNRLALMITIGKIDTGINIQASVYPTGGKNTLPPNLKLMILSETGELFKEVIALTDDQFIRYRFDAETGDKFQIKVALGDASITEEFEV